jgi:hypothetical protein
MARTIAPGNPPEISAKLVDVKIPEFKFLDDMGDARIKAANTNFKLYSEAIVKGESAKLYEQYKTDPIKLANALGKVPEMLSDLPDAIKDEMNAKLYLNSVSLVQKAQNNQLDMEDLENKQNSIDGIEQSKELLSQTYQNILQNHISKAEDKNPIMDSIFLQERMNLNDYADLMNHKGKNVFTESQRKKIRNIDDLELEGFKQFFDAMLLNDNDNLEQSKDYYTKFLLAPERFMSENYMNRQTYEKAVNYAKGQLKQAGADIKKAKFNQNIREATELQVFDLPGQLESLRDAGLIDNKLIDDIEKVNVKFNEVDPSKAESPVAMLNLLRIINQQKYNPAPKTESEQQAVLEQGTAALDSVADYAQTYGLSPSRVQSIRETVVNQETNAAFRPILNNFSDIVDNFESKMNTVRNISTRKGGLGTAFQRITGIDGMDNREAKKLIELNNLLSIGTDTINQQIRNGDWQGVKQTQRDVQKKAAQIYYDMIDWDLLKEKPDSVIMINGRPVQFQDYTNDGDIIVKTLD